MTNANISLTGMRFSKGHGTGNDFVLVADPDGVRELAPEQVAALCDRRRGLGGDGLIRAVRSANITAGTAILEENSAAQWFMDYYNSDGSSSEMCGNGVRVFVHFLLTEGLVSLADGEELAIGTRAGVKIVARTPDGYRVDMGPWGFLEPDQVRDRGSDALVEAVGLAVARPALSITVGNPHTVVALADLDELAALHLTTAPTVTPVPPYGSNVEFTVPAEPLVMDDVAHISMRVHERGVGETLSCGTGACAAAAATRFWAGAGAPQLWAVAVPGGIVGVRFFAGPEGREHVELSGPAEIVAEGVISASFDG